LIGLVISLFGLSRLLLEIGFLAATPQASRAARRFCLRDDGNHFVVRADEKFTAFVELESATRTGSRPLLNP
jgi:hypothetical protein